MKTANNGKRGALLIRDERVHEEIVIGPDLPNGALRALTREVRQTEYRTLMRDRKRQPWCNALEHDK